MLELFGWQVGMTLLGAFLLVVGALVIGVIAQIIGDVRVGWEWAGTALAALVGAYIGSEAFAWGAAFEGISLVPAVIGAIVLGGVVDVLLRYSTEGSYVHHPRPI